MATPETTRKALIFTGLGLCSCMESFLFGHAVSMFAALYGEKEELNLTDETISWIIATVFVPMAFGGLAATLVTEIFGRRLTLVAFNIPIVIYWIVLYYARNGTVIIINRLIAGFCFGGILPTIYISTSEYSSPNNRGLNFAFIFCSSPVGVFLGQSLGLVFHWRFAAKLAIVPAALIAMLPLLFVESPQWLASRGKFKDCEVAFRLLNGYKSEKELQLLLEVERCKWDSNETEAQVLVALLKKLRLAATKKYFWNIMFLGYVIQLYKIICGIMLKSIIFVTTLQHITGQSDILRFTFLVEGLTLLGSIVANFVVGKIRTRILIFTGGILNNIILITFSILTYVKLDYTEFSSWLKTFILGMHYFVLFVSIYPVLEMIPQDIFPLEIKAPCTTIIAFFSTLTLFVYTKIIPDLLVKIDYYGVYLLSVLAMCFCLFYFWVKLPETKGKTLQEIELYFKNEKFVDIDDLLQGDQIKVLV